MRGLFGVCAIRSTGAGGALHPAQGGSWHAPETTEPPATLLDEALPVYEFSLTTTTSIQASPGAILRATRQLTIAEVPLLSALLRLRRARARLQRQGACSLAPGQALIDAALGPGSAWARLGAAPEREAVMGAHFTLSGRLASFRPIADAGEFAREDDPCVARMVLGIRVEPASDAPATCAVTISSRTHLPDAGARRRFARRWPAARAVERVMARGALRAIKRRAEGKEGGALDPEPLRRRIAAGAGRDDALLLLMPPALIAGTRLTFRAAAALAGPRAGYALGFLAYWGGWCAVIPLRAAGPYPAQRFSHHLGGQPRPPRGWEIAALALPPLLVAASERRRWRREASAPVVLLSIALAVVTATAEETLWRGTYLNAFPDNPWLGQAYPTLGFALWHTSPQVVAPSRRPGGVASFVVTSGIVGGLWAWVAGRTHTIRWTILAHALFDAAGLGGALYLGPRALPWRGHSARTSS